MPYGLSFTKKNNGGELNYGDVHFISFYCAVLSRLAYFSDKNFLTQYDKIFGPIIPKTILTQLNSIRDIPEILDDQEVFKLTALGDELKYPTFSYNGKKFIAFNDMAKKINMINGEVKESYVFSREEEDLREARPRTINGKIHEGCVKYISISTSNYGEIYVVADNRMPSCIWVIFRGTYSGKTAGAYTKPTSLIPLYVGNAQGKRESYLYGIFKLLTDSIHTIIEACRYLAVNHLKATSENSVKMFTTGHSLGGALSTIFAYVWMHIGKTPEYNVSPYTFLTRKICCISLGAPRCVNVDISQLFCKHVEEKDITFLRITSRGDPVPAMPFKATYFSHPCSDKVSTGKGLREIISEDCNGLYKITTGKPSVEYEKSLDCSNKKGRPYMSNPLKHTIYLNILYRSAVDIWKFLKSTVGVAEIKRASSGSTVCRIVLYDGTNNSYIAAFFDVNSSRLNPVVDNATTNPEEVINNPTPEPKPRVTVDEAGWKTMEGGFFGKKKSGSGFGINAPKDVVEDVRMTSDAFDKLIYNAKPFSLKDLPMTPTSGQEMQDPFNDKVMPNICVKLSVASVDVQTAGRKKTRKNKKRKLTFKKKNLKNKRVTQKQQNFQKYLK